MKKPDANQLPLVMIAILGQPPSRAFESVIWVILPRLREAEGLSQMKIIHCLLILLLVMSGLLAACGQKGALYMPEATQQEQEERR